MLDLSHLWNSVFRRIFPKDKNIQSFIMEYFQNETTTLRKQLLFNPARTASYVVGDFNKILNPIPNCNR